MRTLCLGLILSCRQRRGRGEERQEEGRARAGGGRPRLHAGRSGAGDPGIEGRAHHPLPPAQPAAHTALPAPPAPPAKEIKPAGFASDAAGSFSDEKAPGADVRQGGGEARGRGPHRRGRPGASQAARSHGRGLRLAGPADGGGAASGRGQRTRAAARDDPGPGAAASGGAQPAPPATGSARQPGGRLGQDGRSGAGGRHRCSAWPGCASSWPRPGRTLPRRQRTRTHARGDRPWPAPTCKTLRRPCRRYCSWRIATACARCSAPRWRRKASPSRGGGPTARRAVKLLAGRPATWRWSPI